MALKKQVLKAFFSVPENRESRHDNLQPPKSDTLTKNNIHKEYKHFKIYDSPSEELSDDKAIQLISEKTKITVKNSPKNTQEKLQTNLGHTYNECIKNIETHQQKNVQKELHTNLGHINNHPKTSIETSQKNIETELRTKLGPEAYRARTNAGQTQDNTKTELLTNLGQIRHIHSFSSLVGLQRKITLFIYEECKFARDKISPPLAIEHLSECCKTSVLSAQKTIQRLIKKEILLRNDFKNGRGGGAKYEVPQPVFQEIIHMETNEKFITNVRQTEDKLMSQLRTNASSSSSLKDLNTTTTEENSLPIEWAEIDLSPLQKNNVMFGKGQIISLWQFLKIHSTFDFQESIDGFAFDVENNHVNARRGYLNLFIGTIRNGLLYVSSHYVSPERQKMNEMLELSQRRKIEKENLESKTFELAKERWISDLTEEERNEILSQQSEGDSWRQCVNYLENEHDAKVIDTWIRPLHAEEEGGTWVLYSPNSFLKEEVEKTFSATIQKFLGDFVLKVGHKEPAHEPKNLNNYSQEEISLRKYFKENLWSQKRVEFLNGL